jgi:hypothetical protein
MTAGAIDQSYNTGVVIRPPAWSSWPGLIWP